MSRHRAPESGFVCRRCGCSCDPSWAANPQHRNDGPERKSCGETPDPTVSVTRLDQADDVMAYLRERQT